MQREREQRGQTASGNLQKLIAAGTIAAGGALAHEALKDDGPHMVPPPPPPVQLIPNVPVEDKPEPMLLVERIEEMEPLARAK